MTVLLINNGGGSIFSFLPIADSLPPDTFNRLWTTPQNVDLSSECLALQGSSFDGALSLVEAASRIRNMPCPIVKRQRKLPGMWRTGCHGFRIAVQIVAFGPEAGSCPEASWDLGVLPKY